MSDIQRLVDSIKDKAVRRNVFLERQEKLEKEIEELNNTADSIDTEIVALDKEISDDEQELLDLIKGQVDY
jgi:predicted  nucleic acid-binding Zn-ribbon protein